MLTEDLEAALAEEADRNRALEAQEAPREKGSPFPSLRPLIMVAEDDEEMCRLLVDALREDGYDVIESEDGRQLMRSIHAFRGSVRRGRFFDVDLIVSDVRMPGASGLAVLSNLRKHDSETPVILITAFGDDETHAEAHRLGAVAVFDKPFDLDEFRTLVRQLIPPESGRFGAMPPG